MNSELYESDLRENARHEVAHRLADGKGILLTELRNEQAERLLTAEITERAQAGEHFPSSLHPL